MIHVSGACDGVFLVVERVHLRTVPPGAVPVRRHPEPGRRKPRAGDKLIYRSNAGHPFVIAPECARRGALPRGRGVRLTLPAEESALLRGLADAEGVTPSAMVGRLVRAEAAKVPELEKPL